MSTLKIGVIGAGSIAGLHLKSYAKNPRVEVVAIADIKDDRAKAVAEQWGATNHYPDAASLLADPAVEAVSICTWNDTHAELAIAALEAGKHVLVEKPMSKSWEQADQVRQAAEKADTVLQVGFVRRHSANARILKQFIDAGELGEIYYARARAIRRVGNPGGWFANKAVSGGGPVIDIGVHVIDLAWYLMGSPKVVAVSGNTYEKLGNRSNITTLPRWVVSDYDPDLNDVEDLANAMVRFENGASLLVDVSYSLHVKSDELTVEVFGDKGGAELEPELSIVTEKLDTVLNITPQISSPTFDIVDGFDTEIDNFVAAALGETEVVAPAWHGSEIQRILDGIYASAAQGREIRFD